MMDPAVHPIFPLAMMTSMVERRSRSQEHGGTAFLSNSKIRCRRAFGRSNAVIEDANASHSAAPHVV